MSIPGLITPTSSSTLPFEILNPVSGGSMSQVFTARVKATGDKAIVKFLGQGFLSQPILVERFEREIAIMRVMEHPNVVRFYDDGWHEGHRYYLMERLTRGSVDDYIRRRKRLTLKEALLVGIQTCRALEYIHGHGILHRDLKPANLFVSQERQIKLGDFGVAFFQGITRLTDSGKTTGTCRYMAPEQITGSHKLSRQTDLYALGGILFEMLTGRAPYNGKTRFEVCSAHIQGKIPSVREITPECPMELDRLIGLMLKKTPSERPAHAKSVRHELEEIKQELSKPARLRQNPVSVQSTVSRVRKSTKSVSGARVVCEPPVAAKEPVATRETSSAELRDTAPATGFGHRRIPPMPMRLPEPASPLSEVASSASEQNFGRSPQAASAAVDILASLSAGDINSALMRR